MNPIRQVRIAGSSVKNWIYKTQITRAIRRFDAAVDHEKWPGVEFHPGYFKPFELPAPPAFFPQGVTQSDTIGPEIGRLAAKLTMDFKSRIVDFIGRDVRLDNVNLFWYDPKQRQQWSLSGSWHDDNVGHRLKIFACFEGNGNTPTVVLPNSYNKPYRQRTSELFRFAGRRDITNTDGQVKLSYKPGDVGLFDTSCLHRGLYEEPAGPRTVLVMEYMNRHKANLIAGKAPCGPATSRTDKIVFTKEAYDALNETGLIDHGILRRNGDRYDYSLAFL